MAPAPHKRQQTYATARQAVPYAHVKQQAPRQYTRMHMQRQQPTQLPPGSSCASSSHRLAAHLMSCRPSSWHTAATTAATSSSALASTPPGTTACPGSTHSCSTATPHASTSSVCTPVPAAAAATAAAASALSVPLLPSAAAAAAGPGGMRGSRNVASGGARSAAPLALLAWPAVVDAFCAGAMLFSVRFMLTVSLLCSSSEPCMRLNSSTSLIAYRSKQAAQGAGVRS